MATMFRTGRRPARRILAEERGGVAIMAALAAMPLTLLAFAAVEFHNYTTSRSDLQDALDAAAMAVARSAETDPAKLQALGSTVLTETFGASHVGYTFTNISFTDADGEVTGSATLTLEPIVSSLFGAQKLSMVATARAARLGDRLEVALVLDNTYSMLTNDRLGITKTGATNFVDTMSAAAARTRVADALKISLVPYSTTVNIGSAYRTAPWMDGGAVSPIHDDMFTVAGANRFTLFDQMAVAWAGCVESRVWPYDVQELPPSSTDSKSLFVPYFAPDEHDDWTYPYTNDYLPDDSAAGATWQQRQGNIHKYDQAPVTTAHIGSGYYYGPNFNCVLQPMVRLTTDMAKVKAGINGMTASGDTYSNVGLMWGWHSLSPLAPFADGAAYGPGIRKIVILMTDGENALYNNGSLNASIYGGGAYIGQGRFGITSGTKDERRAALDKRMVEACTNMKAKGVVVYTIRVEVTTGDGAALKGCATDPTKFYNVAAASDLNATFKTIADSLLNPRIAG
ncbi:MAG: pilus assembly protein TadG-related protein [Pseudomonadota bacterium]|nr:pilus assembly protein TadG-related protein [Pseudomonadota bacterium]